MVGAVFHVTDCSHTACEKGHREARGHLRQKIRWWSPLSIALKIARFTPIVALECISAGALRPVNHVEDGGRIGLVVEVVRKPGIQSVYLLTEVAKGTHLV